MLPAIDPQQIQEAWQHVRETLLSEITAAGHWEGGLSASALSTATSVMACEMIRRDRASRNLEQSGPDLAPFISGGLKWLVEHQNSDGGWGDTIRSLSNISTTMLAHASLHAAGGSEQYAECCQRAAAWIEQAGGVPAVIKRYGKDRTFSIPILTHCALAGQVDWKQVQPLPFELAWLPPKFYSTVRLPVVSYALPALIAIGQARHFKLPARNPALRLLRNQAVEPTLDRLIRIQPENGGFLEAAPLTGFVTMSLAGTGRSDHPVAVKGLEFLLASVRPDGSWPIDTNLATWVSTLSIQALGEDLPEENRGPLREWLLGQQYRTVHAYTQAAPGGWAWTDLPGGVPDADDTPGAVLALLNLRPDALADDFTEAEQDALRLAIDWLMDLQNRDGGWPTFCRGWGTLPFDRSSCDITAHVLRAMHRVRTVFMRVNTGKTSADRWNHRLAGNIQTCMYRGFRFLKNRQRDDGAWLPLWFGNQHGHNDENPTYGTVRVLAAWRECNQLDEPPARRAIRWLLSAQNEDGGWGGERGTPSTVEETSLAVEVLLSADPQDPRVQRGLNWLVARTLDGRYREATPIGFYFARLWYFERLYPLIFLAAALRRAGQLPYYSGKHESKRQTSAGTGNHTLPADYPPVG